ncbi:MAG: SDR family NAD(P)-dependent oxidoreductase, partial [Rikenellaceae bacterium]|nr:SDR family NAD(P)-dependent oxidoreductase [Rikenellaceae bacterium]
IGASSGIGRQAARLLAASGRYGKVGITARREELLSETASVSPERFLLRAFDLAGADGPDILAEFFDRVGEVSLILLCSGTGHINDALAAGPERETVALNVDAFTRVCVHGYNYLASRGGGTLAAVTSVMGLRGSRSAPAYAASKAYQINYLEGLRQKAFRDSSGVYIMDIRPGSVDTAMMKGEGHFWISSPEDAARYLVRAIDRGKNVCYVSPRWGVIGALMKGLPRTIYKRM